MVNVGNWLTATIYFVAAYSCRSTANKTCSHEALFWRSIAILFVVLGFGKILNVEEALTHFGRAVAMSDGWYWHRFVFQKAFILIIGAGIVFLAVGFLTTARKITVQCRVAFTCALLVLGYALVRAISLHTVDAIMSRSVFGLHLNRIPETIGICIVIVASWLRSSSLAA